MSSVPDWHQRYTQQAGWTQDIRRYLFAQVNLERARRVLEVGCGTGAILSGVENSVPLGLYGLDISLPNLRTARASAPLAHLANGDALRLPYAGASFDICYCHFLLLWLSNPLAGLREMLRVTQPGGWVAALAEPDYGGRMDYPAALAPLGQLQARALARQGADPQLGRKLGGLLHDSGLQSVQIGLIGGFWNQPPAPEARDLEWAVLASDLDGQLPPDHLAALRQVDDEAWQQGRRILYVPTFYAWGQVPA